MPLIGQEELSRLMPPGMHRGTLLENDSCGADIRVLTNDRVCLVQVYHTVTRTKMYSVQ
jgi:hypothetical protein